jgi:long-chain fatty acid transport protein
LGAETGRIACACALHLGNYGTNLAPGTAMSPDLKRFQTQTLLAVAVWSFSVIRSLANGFSLADQDAFAMARGEAFVATADNPSAIFYNPAGITQLPGQNLRGGIYGIYLQPTYTPPSSRANAGSTYHSSENHAALPQLFYTFTLSNTPVSFGLGLYAPFGGKMNWPDDTGFRTVALDGKLKYLTINPVMALKLSPSLSIGGGVMVNYVKIDTEQGLSASYRPPAINFYRFSGDGWSVGYNLGLRWQPIDQISIGATLRSAATVTLNGHTEFEKATSSIPDTTLPAHSEYTFPLTAVLGVSYRPTPKWNLEFDATCTDWSSFGTTTIYQSGTTPGGFLQNVPVTLDWRTSWMYEFGVTRYFDNGWHVSAGYVFNESSVPDTYYSPLAADLDRHFFSLGAGFKGKRFDFDVAYQFGYGPTHTVTGSSPSSSPANFASPIPHPADGNYRFVSSAVIVSAGVHF